MNVKCSTCGAARPAGSAIFMSRKVPWICNKGLGIRNCPISKTQPDVEYTSKLGPDDQALGSSFFPELGGLEVMAGVLPFRVSTPQKCINQLA